MNRDEMLAKIEALYQGRTNGDLSKFEEVLAPYAEFRFVGDASITMEFPGGQTAKPHEVADELFNKCDMLDRRLESATIEENRAAVHWLVTLRFKGGQPFQHEMFDLWEFGADGLITKGSQFQDTAKLQNEMDEAELALAAAGTDEAAALAKKQAEGPGPSLDFIIGSK